MASLDYDRTQRKATIQFYDANRKRRTIRLNDITKTFASKFHSVVERLSAAQKSGESIDNYTGDFLRELGAVFHQKLVKVGLACPRASDDEQQEPAKAITLADFLAGYLDRRTDIKAASLTVYRNVTRNLLTFFNSSRELETITEGDAVDFGRFLKREGLSSTTIDRRISLARTIFNDAVRHRLIHVNPFAEVRKPLKNIMSSRNNRSRQRFISQEVISDVLGAAPDAEWRLIIVLARYGGLRTPSEVLSLRWRDIEWDRQRMYVTSPKTEHHDDGEGRLVPIFPELKRELDECWELAEPGAEYVIQSRRPESIRDSSGNWANANLRTTFEKIIRRAGHNPWPKLFQNLRSTRETELMEDFPEHVVCRWIGNSQPVAREHYLQVTEEHFERAVMPSVMPSVDESASTEPQGNRERVVKPGENAAESNKKTVACETMRPFKYGG